jgi:hypothetical protein
MTPVESRDSASAFNSGGRNDQIVVARHLTRRLKFSPNSSVFESSLFCVRAHRQEGEGGLEVIQALLFMGWRSSFNSMPKFRHGDRSDLKFFIGMFCQPGVQIEQPLLAAYDHIRIEDYCHLSFGRESFARAVEISLCQARASLAVNSTLDSASANSRPVQIFSNSGDNRATGFPFFSRTNETF